MDDPALAEPYWCGPGGATGDHCATIALNDAMILSYDANLGRMEFSEGTASAQSLSSERVSGALPLPLRSDSNLSFQTRTNF
jgi:hypothetical protein